MAKNKLTSKDLGPEQGESTLEDVNGNKITIIYYGETPGKPNAVGIATTGGRLCLFGKTNVEAIRTLLSVVDG